MLAFVAALREDALGSIVSLVDDRHQEFVQRAAARVEAFWPGIIVARDAGRVSLVAAAHDDARLEAIWICAVLNERLVVEGAARRDRVLTELLA